MLFRSSPECRAKALETVASLRRAGLRVDYPLRDMPFGKQFKQADSTGARFAVAIGPDEISKNRAKVKNLSTGAESEADFAALADILRA